jgi:hypothetical protein
MADRSPSKPRRSLTPDISLPPSSSSAAASIGMADEGKIRTKDAPAQQDPNRLLQQPQLQPLLLATSPTSPSSHPSPGAVGVSGVNAPEDSVDRSPSKPKRATSPVPPDHHHHPSRPPFHRGNSLKLSLREDPEPRFGPMVPTLLPRQQPHPSIGSATAAAAAAAADLHPYIPSSQLSAAGQSQAQSQQASSYAPYSNWQMSSSLRMDDDSTQTWNHNNNEESTTTFAYSLLDAPPTYTSRDDRAPTARRDGSQRRRRPVTSSSSSLAQSTSGRAGTAATADSTALFSAVERANEATVERENPNDDDGDDDDDRGLAAALGTAGAAADTDSPESSGEHTPTSASLSLTSLLGAQMSATPATTPTRRDQEQQPHRRRRGNGNGNGGGAAATAATSLASSVSSAMNFRPALTMEVAPGVSRPLWHSDTTRRAVSEGQGRECVCRGCHSALFSVRGAAYVLCPVCSTVSDLLRMRQEHSEEGEGDDEGNESAICVGVKRDDAPSTRT